MSSSRSLFYGSRQGKSTTANGNPTIGWSGRSNDAHSGPGDSTVAIKGMSNIEMHGMGYNYLDDDRDMA